MTGVATALIAAVTALAVALVAALFTANTTLKKENSELRDSHLAALETGNNLRRENSDLRRRLRALDRGLDDC